MSRDMIKKWLIRITIIIIVIITCIVFGGKALVFVEGIEEKASAMNTEDIVFTVVDEDTVHIENMIKGDGIAYSWIIRNTIGNTTFYGVDRLILDEKEDIEFDYEDLTSIEFQAVIEYEGVTYTSNTFYVDTQGSIRVYLDDGTSSIVAADIITRDISDIVSLAYLCFLIVVVLLYYIIPKQKQWWILLVASVFFYLLSGIQYIVFILLSSGIAFWVARKMSQAQKLMAVRMEQEATRQRKKELKAELQKENQQWLIVAFLGTLGVMAVIKYGNFIFENINLVFHTELSFISLIMPLGLSFYTFILIAYLIDVYRGKYAAEETFTRFFLFVSFFPQVSQGPISRYDDMAPQLRAEHKFHYEDFCAGAQRILWGFFIKLVLADRIAILVDGVYDTYETQSWFMLMLATLAYSIQIYADFYSCMEIAIGTAQLFGIRLQENFMRPYFSTSMPEFWRRWHSTLGSWFKDYVFYPISMSKKLMKYSINVRKKFGPNVARVVAAAPPIMGVWVLTGLWHGAQWKFVAWGLFHGILILLSAAFSQSVQDRLRRIGVKTHTWDYKFLQMIKVFLLCCIGRVFFRADSLQAALDIFKSIGTFASGYMFVSFSEISLTIEDYIVLPIVMVIFLTVSIVQEKKGSVRGIIGRSNIWVRWFIWLFLIFATLIFGKYGPGSTPIFLYEAF